MDAGPDPGRQGPPGLVESIRRLASTLLLLLQTRAELLATELDQELHRAGRLLLWSAVALLCAAFAVFWVAATVVILLWDSHRIAAASAVTGIFLVGALLAAWIARRLAHRREPLFAATREELRRDRETLDGRDYSGDA
ncbi:MAG: hypothetical protein RL026_2437 [Pseudomonadota bacterium]|jgi:uncharacterized membrane protein YqjE